MTPVEALRDAEHLLAELGGFHGEGARSHPYPSIREMHADYQRRLLNAGAAIEAARAALAAHDQGRSAPVAPGDSQTSSTCEQHHGRNQPAPSAAHDAQPQEAQPVADSTCFHCGAPTKKQVLMRGGDHGWGDDESRTVYRYAAPAQEGQPVAPGLWQVAMRAFEETRGKCESIQAAWERVAAAVLTAAPAQEAQPVAWGFPNSRPVAGEHPLMMVRLDRPSDDQYGGAQWIPLYAAAPAQPAGGVPQPEAPTAAEVMQACRIAYRQAALDCAAACDPHSGKTAAQCYDSCIAIANRGAQGDGNG